MTEGNEKTKNEVTEFRPRNSKMWLLLIILLILSIISITAWQFFNRDKTSKSTASTEDNAETPSLSSNAEERQWIQQGVSIAGSIADSDVIDIGNGQYRMYYSEEPEVADFKARVFSATTTDGINWTKEDGVRKTGATFPDLVKLDNGTYRIYFQNNREIKSAVSSDGLNFTDEPGTRISKSESGYNIDSVGSQTTIKMDDGSYLMVYSGTKENEKFSAQVPNNKIAEFFYATSPDGLTWTKKGPALSSRNSTFEGFVDGPDLVKWDDGKIRMFFWGYKGIYYSVYENNNFSDPILTLAASTDKMVMYAPNPQSDPSPIKIGETWYLYYGQHTKGIYYAEYE